MGRRLIVRQRARLAIAEAFEWYNLRSPGLGIEFGRAADAAAAAVERNPEQYQKIRGEFRRAVLRRFPYSLIYRITAEEIVILTCIHNHRDWRRLDELK